MSIEQRGREIGGITVATGLIAAFLYFAGLLSGGTVPLLLWGSAMVFLVPLRHQSELARRLLVWSNLLLTFWIITDLGSLLLPFALSFFLAYVLDPIVARAERWHLPRWLSALMVNAVLVGIIVLVAVFVAPLVWTQLQDIVRSISSFVTAAQQFLESRQFYHWLGSFGLPSSQVRSLVQDYLIPRLENISQYLFTLVVSFLEGAAGIVAQLVNIILVPLLTFYFLVDLPRLKRLLVNILSVRSPRMLTDLRAIDAIVRAYITGQLITALFVGISAVIAFTIAGIPYGVFLGVICGLLNPIPYVGLLASLLIATVTIVLTNPPHPIADIVIVAIIVNVLHFIAAYLIDPRITGKRVGLHPILLIAALFVFGHFFGFLGLIVAVPATAVLMMYFSRWMSALQANHERHEQPVSAQ